MNSVRLENKYNELLETREKLLSAKEINNEKIKKCNELIDYYSWALNSCLFEKRSYEENVASYKRIINRPKSQTLFDFPLFDSNTIHNYCKRRIDDFEEKIDELDKKKNSISNLITIKKGEKQYLESKGREIDTYLNDTNKYVNSIKVLKKTIF